MFTQLGFIVSIILLIAKLLEKTDIPYKKVAMPTIVGIVIDLLIFVGFLVLSGTIIAVTR